MKLRMYLRGLGLGMIVAALVLTFGVKTENRTMTDAEVRARAKELGMVDEATTLKNANVPEGKTEDVAPEEVKEETIAKEEVAKEEVVKEEAVKEAEKDDKPEEVKQPVEEKKAEEDIKAAEETKAEEEKKAADKKKEEEQKKTDEKKVENENVSKPYTLTIQSGYSSDRVANVLADAGVISSASAFDTYLCSNGYDHRISTGTYAIPAGADFQTIAKMITNSN